SFFRAIRGMVGTCGVMGACLILLCAVFYFAAVKPAETELKAQRDASQRLKSRTPYQPVSTDNRGDDLRRFYTLFPPTDKIAHEAQKLWTIAGEYKIDLQQGEYRLESSGPGLARYRITLPIHASYGQIRQFINFILKEIPTMSIDGLRFERKKISETQLEAQIRLTLYFSPAGTAATATQP
ncbi:MAG TPA: hypothetical protein VK663_14325, partial [Burkholderiales bacterium]|nr:hypothetical protein [Burkholderiales bacterium]